MSTHPPDRARVVPLRPATEVPVPEATLPEATLPEATVPAVKEPLWRHVVGGVLRRERLAQERTLKQVAEVARISMPYLSEVERGRKEASSEVLASAARALGLSLADVLGLVQGELESRARSGRRTVVRRVGAPAQSASPVAPPAPPAPPAPLASRDALRDGPAVESPAVEESGDGAVTSVPVLSSRLSSRRARTRPAAPRPGDVRLAA